MYYMRNIRNVSEWVCIWVLTNAASLHDIFSSLIHCWNWRWWWCWFLSSGLSGKQLSPLASSIFVSIVKFIRMAWYFDNNSNNKMYSVKTDIARRWTFVVDVGSCHFQICNIIVLLSFIQHDGYHIDNLPCSSLAGSHTMPSYTWTAHKQHQFIWYTSTNEIL